MSPGTLLLHVIFAEGVPLCVTTAGSLSRAVDVLVQYTALRCVLHITVLHTTHNPSRACSRASNESTGPGLRPGRLQGRNPALIIRSTYIELALMLMFLDYLFWRVRTRQINVAWFDVVTLQFEA